MSTSIEQRVVQMRFDNKQFESGVAQSMTTLDKLKSALNFKNAAKGFEDISRAADQVSLASIMDQTDTVGDKFNAMSVVAITALQRMTNAAITYGSNMAKSLSVDQITAGWNKYEQKTGSVQTIMNATGKSIDEVNGYLDKLMWFSDETSYGFTDMTAAIGQLTAAGGDIDKLVPMVMGIANATAYAGKGVNEFSRSIYNLNQSYSAGYLQYMDWKSLELAGVASKQLKEVFIETAEELGKVNKGAVTISNFGETLKNKWADTEVMEKAFGKFGEMTEKAYEMVNSGMVETASEAYEILSKTYDGFSIVAARAAQEAKSFGEAVEATKDAVSSGWMKTFEIIFGNYEEAKKLWTDLANTMWDIFASGADARNEMLQLWKDLGGRTALLKTFAKAFENLSNVVENLKSAFRDIFPPITAEQLFNATMAVKNFVYSLELSDAAINTLRVAFKLILLPIQAFVQVVRIGVAAVSSAILILFKLADALLAFPSLIGSANDPLRKLFGDERYERIAQALLIIVTKLGSGFDVLKTKAKELLDSFSGISSSNISQSFRNLIKAAEPLASWILDRIVDGFEALAKLDYSLIGKTIAASLDMMAVGLTYLIDLLKSAKAWVTDFFSQFKLMSPVDILLAIAAAIREIGISALDFFKNLDLEPLINILVEKFGVFGAILGRLAQAVVDFTQKLTPAKILVFSFGAGIVGVIFSLISAINSFKKVAEGASTVLNGVGGLLSSITERVKGNKFLQIASAIAVLAGALIILSQVNPEGLKAATLSLIELMAVFTAMIALLGVIEKFLLKTPEMIKGLKEIGVAMLAVAGAIAVLAGAMYILSIADLEDIGKKLLVIAAMIGGIVLALKAMKSSAKLTPADSVFILSFALALNLMVTAFSKIAKADLNGAIGNLGMMIVLTGLLSVLAATTRGMKSTSGIGMLLMVGSLLVFAQALKSLAKIDTATLLKALLNFVPIFAALNIMSHAMPNAKGLGAGLLAISAGIMIMYKAIEMIGNLDTGVLVKGTVVIGAIMIFYGLMQRVANTSQHGNVKIQGSFIAMGAAILLLGVAIDYIGGMELKKVVQGTIVVGALLLFLTSLATALGPAQKSTGAIVAMTFCIGLLLSAVALLTLLDPVELGVSVAAISVAMVSLGTMIKLIGNFKIGSAIASLVLLGGVLIELGIAFKALNDLNPQATIANAASVGLVLLALGGSMRLLKTSDFKLGETAKTFGVMIAMLGMAIGAIALLNLIPAGEGLLEKAASLSLIIAAISGVTIALSKLNVGVKDSASGAAGVAAVGVILLGFLTAVGAIFEIPVLSDFLGNGVDILNSMWRVVPAIAALTAVTYAMEKLGAAGVTAIGSAASGAAAVDVVGAIILGFVTLVGGLYSANPRWEEYLEKSVDVFHTLGRVFGALTSGFLGEAVGGTIEAVSGVLPTVATNLSQFGENLQGFLTSIDGIDSGKVAAVTSLGDMMLTLTAADLLNRITSFLGGNDPLGKFGEKLVAFGPTFSEFADSISGINETKVTAVAYAMSTLAELMAAIPVEGGLMGAIFGNADIEKFGKGMADFAGAFKTYAEVIDTSTLSKEMVDKTKYATDALVELANKVPASGGALQGFFGEQDLGKFGSQLKTFAKGLMEFFMILSGNDSRYGDVEIDFGLVEKCGNASKALADFANSLPSSGGYLQTWLGEKNIAEFGSQIKGFARGLVGFFRIINGDDSESGPVDINQDIVDKAKYAGEAFAELAKQLPSSGGYWQAFVGSQNLATFGGEIKAFGEGMAGFFESLKGADITTDDVDTAKNAGAAFVELANQLNPNQGLVTIFSDVDLGTFGQTLRLLGAGMYDFYSEINDVDFNEVGSAVEIIKELIDLSNDLTGLNVYGPTNLNGYLMALASSALDEFGIAFRKGVGDIEEAITDTLKEALDNVGDGLSESDLDFSFIVTSMVTSIENGGEQITTTAILIGEKFRNALSNESPKFAQIGIAIINTLSGSLTNNVSTLILACLSVCKTAVNNFNTNLGITNGSSLKFEEIGKYCIQGFINGFKSGSITLNTTMTTIGNQAVKTFSDATGVNSPSVKFAEVGMYSMLGFVKGIEDYTPDVDRAMVKMGGSLLNSIKDFLGIRSPSTVTRDEVGRYIVDGIAEGISANTSAEEAAAKKAQNIVNAFKTEFDKLDAVLNTANLEYELWRTTNPNASAGQANAKQIEMLDKQLQIQAERVNAANAKYQATLKALGASASQTREAYDAYLEEQIGLADLANQFSELGRTNAQAFMQFAELVNTSYDDMAALGWSDEEIKKVFQDQSGWVPNVNTNGSVESIMNRYLEQTTAGTGEVEAVITQSVQRAVSNATSTGKQGGVATVDSMAQGITENSDKVVSTFKESVLDPIKQAATDNGYGTAVNVVEGFADGCNSVLTQAGDAVTNALGSNPLNALSDLLGMHSPSRVYMEQGGYVVQGFAMGVEEYSALPVSAITVMASETLSIMSEQPAQYVQIGRQICSGLVSGIASGTASVASAVASVATQAIATANSILGIHSPSREYYEIGEMMDQGLANGIIDNASLITGAVSSVIDQANSIAGSGISIGISPVYDDDMPNFSSMTQEALWYMSRGMYDVGAKGTLLNSLTNRYREIDGVLRDAAQEMWDQIVLFDAEGNVVDRGVGAKGGVSMHIVTTKEIADAIYETRDETLIEQAKALATVGDVNRRYLNWWDTYAKGQGVINFTQNNYSPETLSAGKIYTNTQTALAKVSAETSPSGQSIKTTGGWYSGATWTNKSMSSGVLSGGGSGSGSGISGGSKKYF